MLTYRVGGLSAAVTTLGDVAAALWNPSSGVPIWVRSVSHVTQTGAKLTAVRLSRTTTRGTPGSTVTPDIDNNVEGLLSPPSGALLDLGLYTVAPAIDASVLEAVTVENVVGAGYVFPFSVNRVRPIKVPPGTGLALVQVATDDVPAANFVYEWAE